MMDFQSIPGLQMTTAGEEYTPEILSHLPVSCFSTDSFLNHQVVEVATPTTRATATEDYPEALPRRRRDDDCQFP